MAIVPLIYFLALACSFLLPLVPVIPDSELLAIIHAALLLGSSTLVACCFLLVSQFILGQAPPLRYWLVLLVPLLGGSFIIYASTIAAADSCDIAAGCIDEQTSTTLYNLFSSSLVILLLVVYAVRRKFHRNDPQNNRHHYWLIITLLLLHLALLALDLLLVKRDITATQADFAAAIIKLGFVYLVLTSLFRVYYPPLVIEAPQPPKYDEQADKILLAKLITLLDTDRIYREMRLNRANLAAKLDVGENTLSRVMNHYLGQSFNEAMNSRRIEEAKTRLLSEKTAIATIGAEVGFNSTSSFNRVFREMTGMSPSQFRQNNI